MSVRETFRTATEEHGGILEAGQTPEHVDEGVSFKTIRAKAALAVSVLVVFRGVFGTHFNRKFLVAYLEDLPHDFDFDQGPKNHSYFLFVRLVVPLLPYRMSAVQLQDVVVFRTASGSCKCFGISKGGGLGFNELCELR